MRKTSGAEKSMSAWRNFFFMLPLLFFALISQENIFASTGEKSDSLAKASKEEKSDSLTKASKKRANKVALMSAIIPGSGQIANKKYWKVPIIYAGGFTLAYFIKINNDEYHNYQDALISRNDNDTTTIDNYPQFTNEDLESRRDYYRRNRDLSYILAGVLYTLNIIDAYVDSQLMTFDVSDDLSLKIRPAIQNNMAYSPVPSLNFTLNFK